MTTTLLFERHGIDTYGGHERELNFRRMPIVSLTGPSGSGKTSMLQTMLYPLGINSRFRRAVRENVSSASTSITAGTASYRLARSLARNTNLIQVYWERSRERLTTLDLTGRRGPTPSEWLFEELGLAELFTGVELSSGKPVAIQDLLPVCYIDQNDTDRQIMRHQTHNSTRKTMLELLLGLSNPDVENARNRFARLERRLAELKRRIATIEEFLGQDSVDVDELKEQLRAAVQEAKQARSRLKALRKRADDAARHGQAGSKQPSQWLHCPRCRADLRRRPVPDGCCHVCLQVEPAPQPTSANDPAEGPVHEAPDPEEIAQAEGHAARADERVKVLEARLEPYRRLAKLYEERRRLESERSEAMAAVEQAEDSASQQRHRLSEFNAHFLAVVKELRPPWFERNAHIDTGSYLPIVEGDNFDEVGGGVRATINVAYHCALLEYARARGITHVPSTLIIDSPRRNLGSNAVDRALAQRVYTRFLNFRQHQISAGIEPRPSQLIIVDNDAPSASGPGVRRVRFDHDDPFVPGVQYVLDPGDEDDEWGAEEDE